MKNRLFLAIIVLAVFAILSTGCKTSAQVSNDNWGTFGVVAGIPVKDFVSMGLIFTEVSFTVDNKKIDGKVFSYQELCKKAEALKADAIINITIDKKSEMIRENNKVFKRETWYGSALAIKYTDVLAIKYNNEILEKESTSDQKSTSSKPLDWRLRSRAYAD